MAETMTNHTKSAGEVEARNETERQAAYKLADSLLNKPFHDPDAYQVMLARQFLRALEREDALREQVKELREDAENWRSLMACPRIRPYGWAGLDENMQPNGKPGIHFGADFWSYGPVEDEQSGPKATQTGAALLKALVADIRARDLMEKTND